MLNSNFATEEQSTLHVLSKHLKVKTWKHHFMFLDISLKCIFMTRNLQLNAMRKDMRIEILIMKYKDIGPLKKNWVVKPKDLI